MAGGYSFLDMYENHYEINTHLKMDFMKAGGPKGNYLIYSESDNRGYIGSWTGFDPDASFWATVTADMYLDGNFLGQVTYQFSSRLKEGKSGNAVVRVNNKAHGNAVTGITGGKEKDLEILKRIGLRNIQVTRFKQYLPNAFLNYAREHCKERNEAEQIAVMEKVEQERKEKEALAEKQTTSNQVKSSGNNLMSEEATYTNLTGTGKQPEFGRDEYGNYYRKDASGTYKQISYDEYATAEYQKQQRIANAQQIEDEKRANQVIQDLQKRSDDFLAERQRDKLQVEQISGLYAQSFYAAQAVGASKQNLDNLSRLSGNYESVEELEAEFNAKYYAIAQEVENLNRARNEALSANVATTFYGSDATGQATGEFIKGVGTMINNNKSEKERIEAEAALREQREQMLKQIEARKKTMMLNMRQGMLAQFPDGGLPLSSHQVKDRVYCFAYFIDGSTLEKDAPVISITNVFPVDQYSDGTWPFKNTLVDELQKLSLDKVTLMGFYTAKEMADEMHTSLTSLSGKCNMKINLLEYNGKASTSVTNDFWETGKKQKSETSQQQNGSFWDQ
ncbi:hypothetical protein C900_02708 [Fulvivirga imtechensis AK7]|uniref:Uncharacterized protein n=2 Tax=Fulvivirga TaxID=396811 RepID=L8JZP2_9BACT|nr:hypothetical protein C900_02708 [Fulvivirga imtechensis AK7]